jgi:hypothetical protein
MLDRPTDQRPDQEPTQPIFFDHLVAELTGAVADLTMVTKYLAATKTLPVSAEAAMMRLVEFVERNTK